MNMDMNKNVKHYLYIESVERTIYCLLLRFVWRFKMRN
jgi:hypothetical protein